MLVGIILTAYLIFATANAAGVEFSYNAQDEWPGVCVTGNTGRQSPIDIVTEDIRASSRLTELRLGDGWRMPISGTYKNGGHNVQFDPTDPTRPSVITTNYLGNYRVLQMHMHPREYLTNLRMIETEDGSPLTLNFRDVQPLGQRMVETPDSETPSSETPGSGSPKLVASALSTLVAIFTTLYFP